MGRLIDESLLQERLALIPMEERTFRRTVEELENAPTVEAILKAKVKNISDNVLTIVREDYIHKADYESRLKADMVAMLIELKNELIDKSWNIDMYDDNLDFECCYLNDIYELIQQKIDKCKTESEEG